MSLLLQNEAAAALDSGCAIVSLGTPAMSGTYPIDPDSLQKLMGTALYIAVNNRFPAKQLTWMLRDINGIDHLIPTPASFLALVTAIADYVAALTMIIDGIGAPTSLPAQPVQIA